MSEEQVLYTKNDTGEYQEYTAPDPPSFHDGLGEELSGNEALSSFEDASQLATSYIDVLSRVPVVPESADDYQIEVPEESWYSAEPDRIAAAKKEAHEMNMTQGQFEAAMKSEFEKERVGKERWAENIKQFQEQSEAMLKEKWGDNYEGHAEKAGRVLKHYAEKIFLKEQGDIGAMFKRTRFGDNPYVVLLFNEIAKDLSEDVFVKPDGDGTPPPKMERTQGGSPLLKFKGMPDAKQ